MAIAFDNKSHGAACAVTSLTVSHTCAGSNLVLLVGILDDGTGDNVTGVTYNGVAMTRQSTTPMVGDQDLYMYYLIAPSTGANDIVVSLSASSNPALSSVSYTDVSQSGFPDSSVIVTVATRTTTTANYTTVADNSWLLLFGRSGTNMTAGSGTLFRENFYGALGWFDSNGAKSPAGAYSLVFTNSSSNTGALGVSIAPFVTPSGPTNLKALDTNLKANIKSYNTNLIANVKSINTNT